MNSNPTKPEKAQRPLILEIEDAKVNIVGAVNSVLKKGLPCYMVADILDSVLSQMRECARRELEAARSQELTQTQSETKEGAENG